MALLPTYRSAFQTARNTYALPRTTPGGTFTAPQTGVGYGTGPGGGFGYASGTSPSFPFSTTVGYGAGPGGGWGYTGNPTVAFGAPTIPSTAPATTTAAAGARARGPSLTVNQAAGRQVNEIIGPQLAAARVSAQQQNAAIKGFAAALMGKLQPIAGQVGADYNQAISQTGALAQSAATFLQQANPTPQVQALLAGVNAPAEQQAQLAGNLGQTFGGAAAVLNFLGGAVPGSELATQKAAAEAQARQYPALAALRGQQDFAAALSQQAKARADIQATRGQLFATARQNILGNVQARQSAAATAAYRAAQLRQGQQRITQAGQAAAGRTAETTRHNIAQETQAKLDASDKNYWQGVTTTIAEGFDPKTGNLTPKAQNAVDKLTEQHRKDSATILHQHRQDVTANIRATTAQTTAQTAAAKASQAKTGSFGSGGIYQVDPKTNAVTIIREPKASTAGSTFHVTKGGKTWVYTKQPNGNWSGQPLPGGPTGGSAAALFPGLSKAEVIQLRGGLVSAHDGVPAKKDASGKVTRAALPPVGYDQAIREAMKHGFSQADATKMANRIYGPNERDRRVTVKTGGVGATISAPP